MSGGQNKLNLEGKVFGRLLVIKEHFEKINGRIFWDCYCYPSVGGCGRHCRVQASKLTSGHTKSCGCLVKDTGLYWGPFNLRAGGNKISYIDQNGLKNCSKCGLKRSLEWYNKYKGNPNSHCKECDYYNKVKSNYNLSKEQYLELGESQNWVCPICNLKLDREYSLTDRNRIAVDHYEKGSDFYVRGLLHPKCNVNYVSDLTYEISKNVVKYLSKFETVNREEVFDAF